MKKEFDAIQEIIKAQVTDDDSRAEALAHLSHIERVWHGDTVAISHDLRSPLNSIIGFAKLLLREDIFGKVTEEERQHYIEIILQSGETLNESFEQFFDYRKLTFDMVPPMTHPFNLPRLIEDIVTRYDWSERMRPHIDQRLTTITQDRQRLWQLIHAAVQYTLTRIDKNDTFILELVQESEATFTILIEGNYSPQAIDAFTLNNPIAPRGLALVKSIAQWMSGEFEILGDADGTCLSITLPIEWDGDTVEIA